MTPKDKTLTDNNRRDLSLHRPEIEKALPEYFAADYPKLAQLFKHYYDHLELDSNSFGSQINRMYANRDATQVRQDLLPFLEDELLLGQSYFGGFINKREAVKFSNQLYRSKGTKYSIEQFFRGFFGIDPVISYPKEDIFKVGPRINTDLDSINTTGLQIEDAGSKLGAESNKFLTNDELYQQMALLIQTDRSVSDWLDVYKLFVHPAGFFLGTQTLVEMFNEPLSIVQDEVGEQVTEFVVDATEAVFSLTAPEVDITLINTGDGTIGMQRQILNQSMGATTTFDSLGDSASLRVMLSPNSVTFDLDKDRLMSDSSDMFTSSTFDQHKYQTLFDSSANSADSANYPL